MPAALFALATMIYVVIAVQDLRQRRVSNSLCAAIAGLGLVRWAAAMQAAPAAWAIAMAILLFAIGLIPFSRGWLGGGDVKLISATALLLGAPDLPAFLFLMSLAGSGLALALLISNRFRHRPVGAAASADGGTAASEDQSKVPYAVAVALAAAVTFFLQIQRA